MHQIRYFLAVSRTLNFTRAAEECNVSQPALTRAVQLLEEELGGELLRRERSNSHLTELGRRLVPLMQQCYDSALAAKTLAHEIRAGQSGALSFAVSRSIEIQVLKAPLAALAQALPGLRLKIHRGTRPDIAEILKRGEAELAVAGPLGAAWERLDAWPLFAEPFDLAVHRAHGLAERNAVELAQLKGQRFLIQGDCEMVDELVSHLNGIGVSANDMHHVASSHDLCALLEADLGIAVVPSSTARAETIRHVPLTGLELRRTVAVYGIAGRRRSPFATALLNIVRAADWSRYHLGNVVR